MRESTLTLWRDADDEVELWTAVRAAIAHAAHLNGKFGTDRFVAPLARCEDEIAEAEKVKNACGEVLAHELEPAAEDAWLHDAWHGSEPAA